MGKLIIEGNRVYELDEQCLKDKENREKRPVSDVWQTRGGVRKPPSQTRRGGR